MKYYYLSEENTNRLSHPVKVFGGKHRLKSQTLLYFYFDLLFFNLSYLWVAYSLGIYRNDVFQMVTFFLLLNASWLLAASLNDNYPFWNRRTNLQMTIGLLRTLLCHAALLIVVSYLFSDFNFAYKSILHSTFFLMTFLSTSRPVLDFIVQKKNKPFRYLLIGGDRVHLESVKKIFDKTYQGKAICVGRFGNTPLRNVRNLGMDKDIIRDLQLFTNIQRVVYVNSDLNKQEIQHLMKLCTSEFIDLIVVPGESNLLLERTGLKNYYEMPIFIHQKEKIVQLPYKVLKRLFDIVFSFIVIVFILSWMIPILAILIKLDSKGPVFFIQRRTGYFNNSFPCIKFRSMMVNDESDKKQATRSDIRITKIGAFLRRNSIDEFPQFINVLLGHMSVVGPRPHPLTLTDQYSTIISKFMIRHSVKPGITGWAQVNGHRGPTETVEQMRIRVEHDIWYIENWTFFLDFKCVFMTSTNFVKGEENAF